MEDQIQEKWKNLFQGKLSQEEERAVRLELANDEELNKEYLLYQKTHETIELLIAEDLRNSLKSIPLEKHTGYKLKKWLWVLVALIVVVGAYWSVNKQREQFNIAGYNEYIHLRHTLVTRGGSQSSLQEKFLSVLDQKDIKGMESLILKNPNHLYVENMSILLAEEYRRKGNMEGAQNIYTNLKKFELRNGVNVPTNKVFLSEAYFFFRTNQKEKFEESIEFLSSPNNQYEWRNEVLEMKELSKKPFAKYFL